MEGTKYDDGKPRLGEMVQDFAIPLLEVTKAWEYGADKYEERNWRKIKDGKTRYTNALLRHLLAEEERLVDEESYILHAAHVAWNALARLWFIIKDEEKLEAKPFIVEVPSDHPDYVPIMKQDENGLCVGTGVYISK